MSVFRFAPNGQVGPGSRRRDGDVDLEAPREVPRADDGAEVGPANVDSKPCGAIHQLLSILLQSRILVLLSVSTLSYVA
jgi:hypothetical protein